MSALEQACEEYLALRRAMGFKLDRHGRLLPKLVAHLDTAGQETITTAAAVQWAMLPAEHPQEWAVRLTIARGFCALSQSARSTLRGAAARVAAALSSTPGAAPLLRAGRHRDDGRDGDHLLPVARGDLPHVDRPARSDRHADRRGDSAQRHRRRSDRLRRRSPRRQMGRGARPAAARDRRRGAAGVPRLRERCWPQPRSSAFFVSARGRRLHPGHARETMRRLRAHAGICAAPGLREPRTHDLRHSFAVATLVDWYRDGLDVAPLLPRLSDYLGHSAPANTYWYLQATPLLLTLAAQRLEDAEKQS